MAEKDEKQQEEIKENESSTADTQKEEQVEQNSAETEASGEEKPAEGAEENSAEEKEGEPEKLTEAQIIESLKKENDDLKDQLLRRAADFDNYRKRMIKEKQETFDYANENLLADLLDSLDNFDRTIDAGSKATDVKSMVEGIKMVNANLVKMLETKYGLTSYAQEGDEFNPDIHEAIGRVEEEGKDKETLKQVYLKGYMLKDKVIRNAKVMVSVPKV
ncbi:MAG: nucleotide exchange factor GrpE [Treponema sp.]|uniref:nucleotide exchange factor GrpE n=1 Tax=Treponema sp. TaxID=166 RepID=UPI001B3E5532|nr:nucleotide exchange factor GrpE [Treponema sp.]MBP5402187.1 nucleotide exchange factor GrpE [Treponema sp.]MBR5933048.1 nucleotide exchange factor GrpE [Treponema sp.]